MAKSFSASDIRIAFDNGFNACSCGIDLNLNPHNKSEAALFDAWNQGHAACKLDLEKGVAVPQ